MKQREAVKYHKNEYGDREREDKVNDNLNTLKIPADIVGNDGIVKISFVPKKLLIYMITHQLLAMIILRSIGISYYFG